MQVPSPTEAASCPSEHRYHFISGLPRSGSTLLSAILSQNPRFHADMSSPVGGLFGTLLAEMSAKNEGEVFIDDGQRRRILKGLLSVSGTANLNGQTLIVDPRTGLYTAGAKYDIVQAGTLTGTFGNARAGGGYADYLTPSVTYSATDAYVTLDPTRLAFTSGQGAATATWGNQLGLLGAQHGLLNIQGGTAGGILTVNGQPDPGVWGRYVGGSGSAGGANLNNHSLLAGYGTEIRPGLIIGGAFASTQAKTDTDVQTVKTRATGLSFYGQYDRGQWRFDAALSGGRLRTDSTRALASLNEIASGSAGGSYAALSGRTAYRLTRGRWFILPHAGLDILHTQRDGYTESGAGLLNLSYAAVTANLTAVSAGVRLGTDVHTRNGMTVTPWVNLGAIAYSGDRNAGQSVTLGTYREVLPASGAPSSAGLVGVGVSLMKGSNWSAQLANHGQFGSGTHMNTANLKAVYRW